MRDTPDGSRLFVKLCVGLLLGLPALFGVPRLLAINLLAITPRFFSLVDCYTMREKQGPLGQE